MSRASSSNTSADTKDTQNVKGTAVKKSGVFSANLLFARVYLAI